MTESYTSLSVWAARSKLLNTPQQVQRDGSGPGGHLELRWKREAAATTSEAGGFYLLVLQQKQVFGSSFLL